MAGVKGYLAIISAVIACPCHLPLLVGLLAGTALGSAITDHYGLAFALAGGYFVVALFLGVRWMTGSGSSTACTTCEPTQNQEVPDVAISSEQREPVRELVAR